MKGLGSVLAAIALLLQVAVPSLHPPVLPSAADGDLAAAFNEHALCLAPDHGDPETPAKNGPKPTDHDFAACCYWHGCAGFALVAAATIERVTFARAGVVFTAPAEVHRPGFAGIVSARGPPVGA